MINDLHNQIIDEWITDNEDSNTEETVYCIKCGPWINLDISTNLVLSIAIAAGLVQIPLNIRMDE